MRPVERGPSPGVFTDYKDARDPLIKRIGDYCSYCENALPSDVDVEHVQPKSQPPYAVLAWPNFLLACKYCNSIKGHHPVELTDYFWPDIDNTLRAFKYEVDQPPAIENGLPPRLQAIAQRTLDLTGLDRVFGHPQFSRRDRRWYKRKEVWGDRAPCASRSSKDQHRADEAIDHLHSDVVRILVDLDDGLSTGRRHAAALDRWVSRYCA